MTNGKDFIGKTTYRQTGDESERIATDKDITQGLYLRVDGGLTKREYFAAMAMQGLLANSGKIDTTNFEWVSEHAIGYADALISELNKTA